MSGMYVRSVCYDRSKIALNRKNLKKTKQIRVTCCILFYPNSNYF